MQNHRNLPPVIAPPPETRIGFESEPITIFSAPRKFDTATILIVTVCYAILFGFLLGVGVPQLEVIAAAAFITIVALSQPLLLSGKNPRVASLLGGMLGAVVVVAIVCRGKWMILLIGAIPASFAGAFGGYLAGALVGGVFLVTHYVREMLESRKKKQIDDSDEFMIEPLTESEKERNADPTD